MNGTLLLDEQETAMLAQHLARPDVAIPQLWAAPMARLQSKVAVLAQSAADAARGHGTAQGQTPGASPSVSTPAPIFEPETEPDGTD